MVNNMIWCLRCYTLVYNSAAAGGFRLFASESPLFGCPKMKWSVLQLRSRLDVLLICLKSKKRALSKCCLAPLDLLKLLFLEHSPVWTKRPI